MTGQQAEDGATYVDSDASSPQYCDTIGRYDPSSSSSAEALDDGNEFVYADGTTIVVDYYADTIGIGGLTIKKQQFGVSNASNATALGIMGLGPNPAYGYNKTAQTYDYVLDSLASREWSRLTGAENLVKSWMMVPELTQTPCRGPNCKPGFRPRLAGL